ncbi:arabinan endo-1,5-alpha-L-arabinosidase [Plebeiibacterium marinum]|uniref:Arabinan endo-1,5-alpha-L-arabinosidase n=1 Tax=Plebeiibacterium marinum TaxID=2992111 RepID=A0AAE3MDA9_9BACT|nr:arabinan endo-1,5-alpha-L-arabinosidase [Plebeiobacterium marinum]MCW3805336.1 arabinan endo-1,5-alpha-L-arabinosidase [Plebeiobacterium marinum]
MALSFVGCNDDDLKPTGITTKDDSDDDTNTNTEHTIPTYSDDYSPIASWADRGDWNLANVHDPSVVFDGTYYYMYTTDASYGNAHDGHGHFLYRRSKDLVNWEFRGLAMSETPAWVKDTLNNLRADVGLDPIANPSYGHWAPVVRKVGNKYRMYYSIVVDNFIGNGLFNTLANFDNTWSEHAFIGLMETSDLASNQWEDKGMVVHSVSDKGTDWSRTSYDSDWNGYFYFNAIDPTFQETPEGKQYLIYGSWHSGIACVELDPTTGKPFTYSGVADKGQRIATRVKSGYWSRWQGSEGPEIMYNEETGYYYLFLAYDGLDVPYNTRVCRATNIEGPYYGIDGANVTEGADCFPVITHPYKFNDHTGWVGFAHNAVFQNEETGDWFYASQARLPKDVAGINVSNAIMMGHVRKIRWTQDGWPVVMPERYTNAPDDLIEAEDLVGTWEHITLNYQYAVQQESVSLILNSSNEASGALAGNWSFDSDKNILTIGSTQLCVEREVDWEANPRKVTLIYSGLSDSGVSLWGKKTK